MKVILVGVGQSLRSDDAVGMVAVQEWQSKYQQSADNPDLRVEIAQLSGLALLDLISGTYAAIIVDAVRSGSDVGTIHQVTFNDLATFTSGSNSAHGWGVAETLALGMKLYPQSLPQIILLIGIEGERFDPGESLSPGVVDKLPDIVNVIEEKIQHLLALDWIG